MKNKILKAALAVAVVLGLPLQVQAYSITILNASFEAPVVSGATYGILPNWVLSPSNEGGVWNLNNNLGGCPGDCWTPGAPDGNQIGWLSVGPSPGSPASMSQVLSNVLLANNTYTLTGFVGHPLHFQLGTIYKAELIAGSSTLASVSGTGPEADFAPFTLSYSSGAGPAIGQPLEIRLSSNQAQTGFDAISLTAVPDGGLTALLLGMSMMGLGWMHRKMN